MTFLIESIFSGRTSRREIRKLLWECLFWRIKRAKAGRQSSKINTHSFLFDDDDDDNTDRSVATTAATTPYCALNTHSQNRSNHLSRQNSNNNYPLPLPRKASFFTCCGLTIDLSHKHSPYSSTGDVTSRRSTICRPSIKTTHNNHHTNTSPRKSRAYSHSPVSTSSFDRTQRQQTICLKLNDDNNNQSSNRRRTTTAVHCCRHSPSSILKSPVDHSMTLNRNSLSPPQSISEVNEFSSIEALPLTTTDEPTTTGVDNANMNSTKEGTYSAVLVQSHLGEQQLPAYIIETC